MMKEEHPGSGIGSVDHVVIVVDDLGAGADIYRRLGFTLSPKGVHSAKMGSANHTIMLQNDYFELLGILQATEQNESWRQFLAKGGGVGGIALSTDNPDEARATWLQRGLDASDPLHFSRPVVREDGAPLEARFTTVHLPDMEHTGVGLFVCSQPTREAVWLPELMAHANTVQAISRLTFACSDPATAAAAWQRIIPHATVAQEGSTILLNTGAHVFELLPAEQAKARLGFVQELAKGAARAVGITFRVADLDRAKQVLVQSKMDFTAEPDGIRVPAHAACNVNITFVA